MRKIVLARVAVGAVAAVGMVPGAYGVLCSPYWAGAIYGVQVRYGATGTDVMCANAVALLDLNGTCNPTSTIRRSVSTRA